MSIQFLFPELFLFAMALWVLFGSAFPSLRKISDFFATLGILGALLILPLTTNSSTVAFFDLLINDPISYFFRFLILLASVLIIFLSSGDKRIEEEHKGEYFFFILSLTVSLMLAVSSRSLLMVYITVEAVSIISYILIGYFRNDKFSSEAGLKYFLFGALSTGIMLYGVSLIYGLCGSLDLNMIANLAQGGHVFLPAFILAVVFILVGLAFKCSLVPFHMVAPDAYQGAPTAVSAFLSIGPKAMGFALLIRLFLTNQTPLIPQWTTLASGLAIITMIIGNIIALKQTNVKRMLAYSSIAHAGFMLMALSVVHQVGIQALLVYLFIYVFMNVGAFGCVILTNREEVDDYAGLSRQNPLAALIMATSLLSLAGLPPLAGFMAKFVVIAAVIQAKSYTLALIAVANSVVALFYYLRIIKVMYLSKNDCIKPINCSPVLILVLIVTVIANILLGLWPQGIMHIITLP
ncbi:MAG: NADH-quinone oxidoreductase subunit N [Candidatus Omnitrophica bacterium]|nr:NADH-quinone oxidoreductase subunit N [Candidatus Omnitrophota bacterium]